MNGITININPVAFSIGHFSVSWYGIVVAVAILAAILVAVREGRRIGIGREDVYSLSFGAIVAGFIGARLFHVVDKLDYYTANPWDIFAIQKGGLAIWGGIIGGALAVLVLGKLRGLPLLRLADGVVPALITGQIIGRFACIVNGDAYGGATSLPWGFIYTHPGAAIPQHLFGIPTHPYPVYEMLWSLGTLLLILRLRRQVKLDGLMFFTYISLYSVGRFLLTFFRQEDVFLWGLQEAQVLAIIGLIASAIAITYLVRTRRLAEASDSG